jgi:dihydrofolate reductase
MRKLVLQMQYSLDGFVCGPKGEVEWAFAGIDEKCTDWIVTRISQAGAHLMGSVTYGDMAAHWPSSKEPYAESMNSIPKVVFSRTLKEAPWGETRILSGDLAEEIVRLKQESGKDLLAHGGARFAQSLAATGLIDEYRLVVHPVVLGSGMRLFPGDGAPVRLNLVDATTFKTGTIAKTLEANTDGKEATDGRDK